MTRRLLGALLIGLMAVGSVLLWIRIPRRLAVPGLADGRLVAAGEWGPTCSVIVGIPVTMIVVRKLLAVLDGLYGRFAGTAAGARAAALAPVAAR
jgi:hypothetical protein